MGNGKEKSDRICGHRVNEMILKTAGYCISGGSELLAVGEEC